MDILAVASLRSIELETEGSEKPLEITEADDRARPGE
jgi:hypothetical protein